MKLTSLSIIVLVIACYAIYETLKRIKNEKIGLRSGLTWIFLWGGIAVIGIFPESLNILMNLTKMRNRILFVLLGAVIILFALIFNLSSTIDNQNRNLRKLTREIAIVKYKLSEKKKTEK